MLGVGHFKRDYSVLQLSHVLANLFFTTGYQPPHHRRSTIFHHIMHPFPNSLFYKGPCGLTVVLSLLFDPTAKQIEKAFQKQQGIFQNAKVTGKKSVKNNRWYKEVGLGFKTPKEAIEGHYIDKKCPFTGDVSIRGRILTGEIISTKMKRTIIIRREYLHFISKYNRYEKRHKNLAAHISPCFIGVQQGDSVTVGQCRPLSKTVRFNVLKVQKKVVKGAKNFAKF
ncbi:30S ribosomal protein S11, chloroplastic [Mortierella sp. AD094]|nr:30S ribosomal protein S11, chloroplastic [Mortierella sp. AD094]